LASVVFSSSPGRVSAMSEDPPQLCDQDLDHFARTAWPVRWRDTAVQLCEIAVVDPDRSRGRSKVPDCGRL